MDSHPVSHNQSLIDPGQRPLGRPAPSLYLEGASCSPLRPSQPQISRTRRRRAGLEPVLPVPNLSLQLHRKTQVVWAIGCVRLGAFDAGVCVIKSAFIAKQPCQVIMSQKQVIVLAERRRNSEDYFEMVNSLLCLTLGLVYPAENMMRIRSCCK